MGIDLYAINSLHCKEFFSVCPYKKVIDERYQTYFHGGIVVQEAIFQFHFVHVIISISNFKFLIFK